MISLIVFADSAENIKLLLNNIEPLNDGSIAEIISNIDANDEKVRSIETTHKTKAAVWNELASFARHDQLWFVSGVYSFSDSLIPKVAEAVSPNNIVSPNINSYNNEIGAVDGIIFNNITFGCGLELRNKLDGSSVCVSDYFVACSRDWFERLGGFDDGLLSVGAGLELSVRSWLFGGGVKWVDGEYVGVVYEHPGPKHVVDLARICAVWFPAYSSVFYDSHGLANNSLNIGNYNKIVELQRRAVMPVERFLRRMVPEFEVYADIRFLFAGRSVVLVSDDLSDSFDLSLIGRYEVVVGVDNVGMLLDCDYVFCTNFAILNDLVGSYGQSRLFAPKLVVDSSGGGLVNVADVWPDVKIFDTQLVAGGVSLHPPFYFDRFKDWFLTFLNVVLYCSPESVTIVGYDCNSPLKPESELRNAESVLKQFGSLARSTGVNLFHHRLY